MLVDFNILYSSNEYQTEFECAECGIRFPSSYCEQTDQGDYCLTCFERKRIKIGKTLFLGNGFSKII